MPQKPSPPELLFGPYRPPALKKGDRATCLDRDRDVVVTGWSAAPIGWPCCRVPGRGGAPTLLVDEELGRAIRHESAEALGYWWGVSSRIVTRWRRHLGVGRMDSEGSRRLILAASERGAERVRGKPVPRKVRKLRRQTARQRPRPWGRKWTAEELALLGTWDDGEVAARTGRTADAVRLARDRKGIPAAGEQRQR
jgi:hypothetical protein